jgi:hypothetical protein
MFFNKGINLLGVIILLILAISSWSLPPVKLSTKLDEAYARIETIKWQYDAKRNVHQIENKRP